MAGRSGGDAERFEGLRRRLEGESRAAAAAGGGEAAAGGSGDGGDGSQGQGQGQQRRPLAGQILDRFTGSF